MFLWQATVAHATTLANMGLADQTSTRGAATLYQHLLPTGSPTSPETATSIQKPARQQSFSVTRALLKSTLQDTIAGSKI